MYITESIGDTDLMKLWKSHWIQETSFSIISIVINASVPGILSFAKFKKKLKELILINQQMQPFVLEQINIVYLSLRTFLDWEKFQFCHIMNFLISHLLKW